MPAELTFRFPDEASAQHFAEWMSDGGEQAYYAHCEIQGRNVGRWQYHAEIPDPKKPSRIRYGLFLADRLIILHPPE